MPDVPPRNIAMEIASALGMGDSQTLARIGYELLESVAVGRATIASMEAADEARRRQDAERQRRRRQPSRDVTEGHGMSRDSPPLSPTPPFPTSTSSSSSPAREALGWQPEREARLARRLVTDAGRVSLAGVLAKCDDKTAVAAEIGMILDGGRPGCSKDPAVMELALADYLSNGMSAGRFNAKHFRRHVQSAAVAETPRVPRHGNPGAQAVANIMGAHSD